MAEQGLDVKTMQLFTLVKEIQSVIVKHGDATLSSTIGMDEPFSNLRQVTVSKLGLPNVAQLGLHYEYEMEGIMVRRWISTLKMTPRALVEQLGIDTGVTHLFILIEMEEPEDDLRDTWHDAVETLEQIDPFDDEEGDSFLKLFG